MVMEFEIFVKNYQDMVFSTAMRIVGVSADAEDISQNVFVLAYKHFAVLKDDPAAGGWLRTCARNHSINHYNRYQKRWRFFGSLDNDDGVVYDPAQPEVDESWLHSRLDDLRDALTELPAKYRAPLVLYHYEDLSYEEIADRLKISLSKVKTDISRGRELLRKKVFQTEVAYA
jgi:RNA polymerase sigma-70 factor (ECF subfamily)